MRIVGGAWRGRPLASPRGQGIRPTTDRARETLFNILAHDPETAIEGERVLDLFAGTGALGFEALSRGAATCLFVENGPEGRALLRETIDALGAGGVATVFRRDATRLGPWTQGAHALVFLDPPYGRALGEAALRSARDGGWIAPGARIVLEEAVSSAIEWPEGFEGTGERRVGDTMFHLARFANPA